MSKINEAIDRYFELQREIHDHVGYEENWRAFPLDDQRGCYWMIVGTEKDGEFVWSPNPLTEASIEDGRDVYSGTIYPQRHLSKWVYRSSDVTLVVLDTQTDANIFLTIFDSSKECKNVLQGPLKK